MTHSLTLQVPQELFDPLSEAANRAGTTPESVAIEWLEIAKRHKTSEPTATPTTGSTGEVDPFEKWVGAIESNRPGWSREHDRHIGEAALRHGIDEES